MQGVMVDKNRDTGAIIGFKNSAERARADQLQGMPVRVLCCWNGAAVLNPAPFLQDNVRFRRASMRTTGECSASECNLLCKDFLRLGYDRIMMVPTVVYGYTLQDQRAVQAYHNSEHVRHEFDAFFDVQGALVDFPQLPSEGKVECQGVESNSRIPDQIAFMEKVVFGESKHKHKK
jgi:hypothetical protein